MRSITPSLLALVTLGLVAAQPSYAQTFLPPQPATEDPIAILVGRLDLER